MSGVKTIPVVGVSFTTGYPDNLHALAEAYSGEPEGLAVVLVRNPANQYDANAVEVHVPALGERDGMIGHVSREHAKRLAPLMDDGVRFGASVSWVRINPDHPDRPGIDIAVRRVDEEHDQR